MKKKEVEKKVVEIKPKKLTIEIVIDVETVSDRVAYLNAALKCIADKVSVVDFKFDFGSYNNGSRSVVKSYEE